MRRAVAGLLSTLILAGCAPAELACTEIGSPAGVSVTIDRDIAPRVDRVVLTVCVDGACRDHAVPLAPGSVAVDQGCDGTAPDAACSATVRPTGTLVGFAPIRALRAGDLEIGARLTRAGRTNLPRIALRAAPTFPNGPACPTGGPQVAVRITAAGLRSER